MATIEEISIAIIFGLDDQEVGQDMMRKITAGRKQFTPPTPPEKSSFFYVKIGVPLSTETLRALPPGIHLVGRKSESSSIQLLSRDISRFHCLVEVREDGIVTIQDLESRNGTTVNDVRLEPFQVYELHPLEVIALSENTTLVLMETDQPLTT